MGTAGDFIDIWWFVDLEVSSLIFYLITNQCMSYMHASSSWATIRMMEMDNADSSSKDVNDVSFG